MIILKLVIILLILSSIYLIDNTEF